VTFFKQIVCTNIFLFFSNYKVIDPFYFVFTQFSRMSLGFVRRGAGPLNDFLSNGRVVQNDEGCTVGTGSFAIATEDKSSSVNYTDLAGGKYFIDDSHMEAFMEALAKQKLAGKNFHLCEIVPREHLRRFAMDLDLRMDKAMSESDIMRICKQVHRCLEHFYPSTLPSAGGSGHKVYVLSSDPKRVAAKNDSPAHVGYGLHIYTDFIVTYDQALQISQGMRTLLHVRFGTGEPTNGKGERTLSVNLLTGWEKIVDMDIQHIGLRLLYANKAEMCPCASNRALRRLCESCERGLIDKGRSYGFWFSMSHLGLEAKEVTERIQRDLIWAFRTFCMRVPQTGARAHSGFIRPDWCPLWVPHDSRPTKRRQAKVPQPRVPGQGRR
jgi:hypothetical protein